MLRKITSTLIISSFIIPIASAHVVGKSNEISTEVSTTTERTEVFVKPESDESKSEPFFWFLGFIVVCLLVGIISKYKNSNLN